MLANHNEVKIGGCVNGEMAGVKPCVGGVKYGWGYLDLNYE